MGKSTEYALNKHMQLQSIGAQMRFVLHLIINIGLLLPTVAFSALPPDQLYSKLSASVFIVESLNADGKLIAQGSGLAIAPGEIATNCHVVEKASRIQVVREGKRTSGITTTADKTRDICILRMGEKTTPTLRIGKSVGLKVGQRVYAIGAPMGLELTLSEGIISSLRKAEGGFLIQTTTPISPGSSGGGLFDENGFLIGITTFQTTKGQNLNFAVPAEWISEVPERHARSEQVAELIALFDDGAKTLGKAERWGELQKLAEDWIRRLPSHLGGWYQLGRAQEKQGLTKEAMASFRRAVESNLYSSKDGMTLWVSYISLAQLQRNAGNDEGCADTYASAMLLIPLKEFSGNMLGCYRRANQFERAQEAFRKIILHHPTSEAGWEGLGGVYLITNKPREAQAAFEKAVAIAPDFVKAWIGLLVAAMTNRDEQRFMMAAERLNAIAPDVARDVLKGFQQK